jgi:hypothetical protein
MARGPLAGAAGPGKFSVRTDGLDLGSIAYGEGGETEAIKGAMPLSTTPDVRPTPASQVREAASATRLFDESQRADEDIMRGSPMGPQEGPEVLAMNAAAQRDGDIVAKYKPMLEVMAAMPDTPESFRIFVRYI